MVPIACFRRWMRRGRNDIFALLVRLVRPGETGGATRRTALLEEFSPKRRDLARFLATADGGRLVLIDAEGVEIAHEALIRQWSWLQAELQPEIPNVRRLHQLIARARVWSDPRLTAEYRSDKDHHIVELPKLSRLTRWMIGGARLDHSPEQGDDRLIRGYELERFRALSTERPDWLSDEEHRFVSASSERQDQDNSRTAELFRLLDRGFLAAFRVGLIAVLLAIGLGVAFWIVSRAEQAAQQAADQAHEAELVALRMARSALTASAETASAAGDYTRAAVLALSALSSPEPSGLDPAALRALGRAAPHLAAPVRFDQYGRSHAAFLDADCALVGDDREGVAAQALRPSAECRGLAVQEFPGMSYRLVVGPSRTRAAVGTRDGGVIIADLTSGRSSADFAPLGAAVSDIAFSPDGDLVGYAMLGRTAIIRSVDRPDAMPIRLGDGIARLAFAVDGQSIVAGTEGGDIIRYDAASGVQLVEIGGAHSGAVTGVAVAPDGRTAVTIGADGAGSIWRLGTPIERVGEIVGLDGEPESLAFAPEGRRIAIGRFDGGIRVYALPSGNEVVAFESDRGPVLSLDFSPDGQALLAGMKRGVALYDLSDQTGDGGFARICGMLEQDALRPETTETVFLPCSDNQRAASLPPIWSAY